MININKRIIALLIAVSALSLSGCFLAAVTFGGGTVAYIKGNYSMNIKQDYQSTYKSAVKAIRDDTSYMLVSKNLGTDSAEIDGATKIKSSNFTVNISKITSEISKVTIRFGNFGNQERSTKLMDQIQANINSSKG